MAIASRVSRLEATAARRRRDLADRDCNEADLRARLAATLDLNPKLMKERNSAHAAAKKLSRNLARVGDQKDISHKLELGLDRRLHVSVQRFLSESKDG